MASHYENIEFHGDIKRKTEGKERGIYLKKDIAVYDFNKQLFREINPFNYNDDMTIGAVFFSRESLKVIEKYYCICGYLLMSEENMLPIDIHDHEIVFLEGTFNNLPNMLQKELIVYNLDVIPETIFSSFFWDWQFEGDWDAFTKHGSFIKLCDCVIGDDKKRAILMEHKDNIIYPLSYDELSELVQILFSLYELNIYSPEYIEEFNYTIDALKNGYKLNMTSLDIAKYTYQICSVITNEWK